MSKEFAGLTAAVTGAGSGIGLATAKILADGGAKVYGLDIAEGGLAGVGEWLQCDVGMMHQSPQHFQRFPLLTFLSIALQLAQ